MVNIKYTVSNCCALKYLKKFFFLFLDFSEKYKGAITFLVVLLFIAIALGMVYLMLKKGISCCACCCCCGTSKSEEEENLYTDPEHDEEDEILDEEQPLENEDVPSYDEEAPPLEDEELPPHVPEIIVTEGSFKQEKKTKKAQISNMFKKIKKGKGRVRFSSDAEKVSMIDSEPSNYGSMGLAPLQRSDSMESFMSSMSTATTNVEEFGEELSPSRLQVFIQYDPRLWTLTVGAKQAECLVSTTKDSMYWQAHMTLLPFKKHRFKTKYKSTSTPIFNQNFEIENIAQQALSQLSVRYRIYGRPGRTGRKKLAGEAEVELSAIMQMDDRQIKDWRVLRRRGAPPVKSESDV